jgi:hypothetical protein
MRRFGLLLGAVLLAGAAPQAQQLLTGSVTPNRTGLPTVTPAHVACTDVPTTASAEPALRILSGQAPDLHEHFAAGEIVVLNGNTGTGIAVGQQYYARRAMRGAAREPISAEYPGAIRTAGWVTVTAVDERFALARVDFACDAVMTGDYLEPFQPPTMADPTGPDGPPDFDRPIWVLFGKDRTEQFGAGDILSIQGGTGQGLAPGTRVAFYRDRRLVRWRYAHDLIELVPLVHIGEGHVVALSGDSARVLVTKAIDAVKDGDLAYIRTSRP